jgi:hypothetical protein
MSRTPATKKGRAAAPKNAVSMHNENTAKQIETLNDSIGKLRDYVIDTTLAFNDRMDRFSRRMNGTEPDPRLGGCKQLSDDRINPVEDLREAPQQMKSATVSERQLPIMGRAAEVADSLQLCDLNRTAIMENLSTVFVNLGLQPVRHEWVPTEYDLKNRPSDLVGWLKEVRSRAADNLGFLRTIDELLNVLVTHISETGKQ